VHSEFPIPHSKFLIHTIVGSPVARRTSIFLWTPVTITGGGSTVMLRIFNSLSCFSQWAIWLQLANLKTVMRLGS
jgi:hypothetical protein